MVFTGINGILNVLFEMSKYMSKKKKEELVSFVVAHT